MMRAVADGEPSRFLIISAFVHVLRQLTSLLCIILAVAPGVAWACNIFSRTLALVFVKVEIAAESKEQQINPSGSNLVTSLQ